MSSYADGGWASAGYGALAREKTGRPRWKPEPVEQLTWQEIIRANADFPGAFLRYFRSLGMPA